MVCREQRACEVRLRAPRGALPLARIGVGGLCAGAPVLLTGLLRRLSSWSFRALEFLRCELCDSRFNAGGLSGAGRSVSDCLWVRVWRRPICKTVTLCVSRIPRLLRGGTQFFTSRLMLRRTLAGSTTRGCELNSLDLTAYWKMVVSEYLRTSASVAAGRLRIQANSPRRACRNILSGAFRADTAVGATPGARSECPFRLYGRGRVAAPCGKRSAARRTGTFDGCDWRCRCGSDGCAPLRRRRRLLGRLAGRGRWGRSQAEPRGGNTCSSPQLPPPGLAPCPRSAGLRACVPARHAAFWCCHTCACVPHRLSTCGPFGLQSTRLSSPRLLPVLHPALSPPPCRAPVAAAPRPTPETNRTYP